MNGSREVDPRLDPRIHAYLDGDLSASEAQAFEGDLRSGSTSGNQLESLKQLRAWFRSTRPRAPSNLARRVQTALEQELETRDRVPASAPGPSRIGPFGWIRRQPRFARVWVPAAAAVGLAILVVLLVPGDPTRDPTPREGGIPPPPDRAALEEPVAPSPALIRTSRNAAPTEVGSNTVRYVFTVKADRAREICLAGDFNQWKVCDAPLARLGGDLWSITIDLPRGRHEYMFVVDGRWVTDPDAMGYSDDGFGNRNALLVI